MKKTVTLITGYLGSGKTTLLKEFLKNEKNNQIINCFSCIDGRINFGFCSKKKSIVCTTFPEYDWVMNILGEKVTSFDVTLLQNSGTDLHSYQPSVKDIAKISKADLFVYVGSESDEWVEKVLSQSVNKNQAAVKSAKKSFKELSGGQQQRVLFARALCAASSILVMDEPAKGFDSEITEKMHQILKELNEQGLTIITISHDREAAEKYGTKILKLGENPELVEAAK